MKRLLSLILLPLVVAPALCEEGQYATDVPTTLAPYRYVAKEGDAVYFSGELIISGEFIAGWTELDGQLDHIQIRFFPSKDSTKKLPYMTVGTPEHQQGKRVRELFLAHWESKGQGNDNVRELLPPSVASDLITQRVLEVRGKARISISNYFSSADCGERRYYATLQSLISSEH